MKEIYKFGLQKLWIILFLGMSQLLYACPNITHKTSYKSNSVCIPITYKIFNNSTGINANTAKYYFRKSHSKRYFDSIVGLDSIVITLNNYGKDTIWMFSIDTSGCKDSSIIVLNTTSGTLPQIYDDSSAAYNHTPRWYNCIVALSTPDSFRINLFGNGNLKNYKIVWGDGKPDTANTSLPALSSISHLYDSTGTYIVKIVAENTTGCIDTIFGIVVNEKIPVAGVIGPPTGTNVGCVPHTIRFINNSSNITRSTLFLIEYGDSITEIKNAQAANDTLYHRYSTAVCNGTMAITAYNACGSSKATWSPIFVNNKNKSSFTVNNRVCDTTTPFTFINTSESRYCLTYNRKFYWDFGDGKNTGWIAYPAAAQQVHYYKKIGFYNVMLLDSNPCGIDTFIYQIAVNFYPIPGFIIDKKIGCFPLKVKTIDTSIGLFLIRKWDFGSASDSNNISSDTIQNFKYNKPGTYRMRLSETNSCGTRSTDYITITVLGPPKAKIDSLYSACLPTNISFANKSTFVSSSPTYLWDFGNGDTSTLKNPPNKLYKYSDSFKVKLIIYDTCGVDSITKKFIAYPNPKADFTVDTICQNDSAKFKNNTIISNIGGTNINIWNWNFGDTKSSTSNNPVHRYTDSGIFTINLIATSSKGCKDTLKKTLYVVPKPLAKISVSPNDTICMNDTINFDGTSTAFFGRIISHKWNFGNGDKSSQEDTLYRYKISGNYTANYIIQNSYGCKDSTKINISIQDIPKVGVVIDTACLGSPTHFKDTSKIVGNKIIKWSWDLNQDGIIDSTSKNPSYTYNTIGSKKVFLEVKTAFGCKSNDSFEVNIFANPKAEFLVSSSNNCSKDSITFKNNSIGAKYHHFYFGDGTSRKNITNTNSIKHSFPDSGTYNVKLVTENANGCKDSTTISVIIGSKPDSKFTVNKQFACSPDTFIFKNISKNTTKYFWLQNDTFTGNYINRPDTLIVTDTNSFVIKLVAANASVCPNDTFEMRIGTSKNPIASFSNLPDSGCGALNVSFKNTSQFSTKYSWNFGNGITSMLPNPTQVFKSSLKNDSIYNIKLVTKNWLGCADSIIEKIKVFPNPTVNFSQSQTDSCGDLLVNFTNTSVHNANGNINDMRFDWSFGNGIFSSKKDTVINFISSQIRDSIYTIQLIGYSKNACSDTVKKIVTVYPNATADFIINQVDSCGPFTVKFTNKSVPNNFGNINIMSFNWDFGNGKYSSKKDTVVKFFPSLIQDSIYKIILIAKSEHGCPDTIQKTVNAHPKPKAIFNQSDTDGCGPLTVNFQNKSIPYDTGSIKDMTFLWNFGDGKTSILVNPSHVFLPAMANDTVYKIQLIAFSEHGCADTSYSTIRVYAGPVASFSVNKAIACAPFNFTFKNLSYNSDSFVWLSDGNISHTKTFQRNDTLIQNDSSISMIGVIAYSEQGCPQDTNFMSIGTANDPVASFINSQDSGCGPLKIDFTNTSKFAIKYHWSFGKNDTSVVLNPSKTFKASTKNDSLYYIKLIATNWLGCKDSVESKIKVFPNPTVVFTQSNTDSCGDLLINFTNNSMHNGVGNINDMTFKWNFGNGNFSNKNDTSINYVASKKNDTTYYIKLIGYSKNTCSDTAKKLVIVYPNSIANFSVNQVDSCGPFSVKLNNQSLPNNNGNISIMTFKWDFGNGKFSSKRDTVVKFFPSKIKDSIYSIKLFSYSEHGCPDTISKTIRVYPKPKAAFIQSDTSGCGPLTVNFQNISVPFDTGSVKDMSFMWDFGNGITSLSQDAKITFYAAIGRDTIYTIRLIAKSEHGCLDTFFSKIIVRPNPSIEFTQSDTLGCEPLTIDFVGSGLNLISFNWNLGNGILDTGKYITHVFKGIPLKDTTYYIKLSGASLYGCPSDTVYSFATAKSLPLARFEPKEDTVCVSSIAQMLNNSLGGLTYFWNFGNGDTSSLINPSSYFTIKTEKDTSYKVSLIATNQIGCRDTAIEYVVVLPKPIAKIYADTLIGCDPLQVQFYDTSIFGYSYYWHFGNGDTSTLKNPISTFTNKGGIDSFYNVSMVVKNKIGCSDTTEISVKVYPKPNVAFNIYKPDGCSPLINKFVNSSIPNDTGTIDIMHFIWDFGNGDTSTKVNASSEFYNTSLFDTIYPIKLTAFTEHGCSDSLIKSVQVYPNPLSKFDISDTVKCGPANIGFTNQSSPNDTGNIDIMSFIWDFGNGKFSYGKNDTTVFNPIKNADTTYHIKLIALSEHGCRDTADTNVTIYPYFFSKFDFDNNNKCGPMTVNFRTGYPNIVSFFWDFGNGDTTSQQFPSRTFTNTGFSDSIYLVKHVGLSAFGCPSDTFYENIVVLSVPKTDFVQNADSLCGDQKITFSNQTVGANVYKWTFGNGDSSSQTHPSEFFKANTKNDTTYTVKLLAKSYQGCENYFQKTVTLFAVPIADFSIDTSKGCTDLKVHFSNKSHLSDSIFWNFGNGQFSSDTASFQIFQNHGLLDTNFLSKLMVKTVRNCKDSMSKSLLIYPKPNVNFLTNNDDGCGTLNVSFNNQSRPNDTGKINIMKFDWDLGNGVKSNAIQVSSKYISSLTKDTIYTVKLIGYSEHGCKDSVSKQIQVYPKPLANFNVIDSVGCGPFTTIFKNKSLPYDTSKISDMNFLWDFGNGIKRSLMDDTITFVSSLKKDTIYKVTLVGISEHNCKDTFQKNITVRPKPLASFTADKYNGCAILDVKFSSTNTNSDSIFWDFNNGKTTFGASPNTSFNSAILVDTVYHVRMWTKSKYNCKGDTLSKDITVHPNPITDFTSSTDSLCGGGKIQYFNATQSASVFNWNFGDGSISTKSNPSHNFKMIPVKDTIYKVELIATSMYGCKDTLVKTNTMFPMPRAIINADKITGCAPLNVNFTDISHLAFTHLWDFGDGNVSSIQNPNHTFFDSSIISQKFNVKYVIKTKNGCSDSSKMTITTFPLPIPVFFENKQNICDTSNYIFTNKSINAISYKWYFGDGDSSIQNSPKHLYPNSLNIDTSFNASLIATTNVGCKDTLEKTVIINPLIYAEALAISNKGCQPLTVNFASNSRNTTNHFWIFGDGGTSSDKNPTHNFNNTDTSQKTFKITLIATDKYGCNDTSITQVDLFGRSISMFTFSKIPNCDIANYQFNNLSKGGKTYDWDFGDGRNSTLKAPQHNFPTSLEKDTIFNVRLITKTNNNCQDTSYLPITIHPIVQALFEVNDTTNCGFMNIQFSNKSKNANYYQWRFGNGINSSDENPLYTYSKVGSYQTNLIALDGFGCADTFNLPELLTVYEIPKADFMSDVNYLRLPKNKVFFTDLSLAADPLNFYWDFDDNGSGINNNSIDQNPSHDFSDSGNYNIQLIVNNNHCFDTTFRTLRIDFYYPIASFIQNPDSGCLPLEVQFIDNSLYTTSYQWYFGDGAKSIDQNPIHIYQNPGKYSVTLIASGPGGNDDTMKTDVIKVNEKPFALFYSVPLIIYRPDKIFVFKNESVGAINYVWDVFDENNKLIFNSIEENPTPIIEDVGTYTTRLIAENEYGCLDTLIRTNYLKVLDDGIIIVPSSFTPNGDGLNDGFSPIFEGVSENEYLFTVFNRWGEKVFETNRIYDKWDGKFKGLPCQIDMYVWQTKGRFMSGKKFGEKGRVTLLR